MKTIRFDCETKDALPLSQLTELQGKLKSLDDEDAADLKRQIVETGFAFPVYVWKDPLNKTNRILGGHQRVRVLRQLEDDGYEVGKVPVVFIRAKNLKEARRRILQDISQFGKVTKSGLKEFMEEGKFAFKEIKSDLKVHGFDMDDFEEEHFPSAKPEKKAEEPKKETREIARSSDEVLKVVLHFKKADYAKLMKSTLELSEKLNIPNLSDLFQTLVNDKIRRLEKLKNKSA